MILIEEAVGLINLPGVTLACFLPRGDTTLRSEEAMVCGSGGLPGPRWFAHILWFGVLRTPG